MEEETSEDIEATDNRYRFSCGVPAENEIYHDIS